MHQYSVEDLVNVSDKAYYGPRDSS